MDAFKQEVLKEFIKQVLASNHCKEQIAERIMIAIRHLQ